MTLIQAMCQQQISTLLSLQSWQSTSFDIQCVSSAQLVSFINPFANDEPSWLRCLRPYKSSGKLLCAIFMAMCTMYKNKIYVTPHENRNHTVSPFKPQTVFIAVLCCSCLSAVFGSPCQITENHSLRSITASGDIMITGMIDVHYGMDRIQQSFRKIPNFSGCQM